MDAKLEELEEGVEEVAEGLTVVGLQAERIGVAGVPCDVIREGLGEIADSAEQSIRALQKLRQVAERLRQVCSRCGGR